MQSQHNHNIDKAFRNTGIQTVAIEIVIACGGFALLAALP